MHFFSDLNNINLKTFPTVFGYTGLREHSTKIMEKDKSLRGLKKSGRMCCWGYAWTTSVVIKAIFVYHFVNPDLRNKILFEKEEATQ